MSTSRFTKLDENLSPLSDDAAQWSAVLDNTTNLIWSADNIGGEKMTQAQAKAACAGFDLGGKSDWRLSNVEELFCLADRSRHLPAIDTAYFPSTKSDWYLTSSPVVSYPDYVWVVSFLGGGSTWGDQNLRGWVRAVRSASQ